MTFGASCLDINYNNEQLVVVSERGPGAVCMRSTATLRPGAGAVGNDNFRDEARARDRVVWNTLARRICAFLGLANESHCRHSLFLWHQGLILQFHNVQKICPRRQGTIHTAHLQHRHPDNLLAKQS